MDLTHSKKNVEPEKMQDIEVSSYLFISFIQTKKKNRSQIKKITGKMTQIIVKAPKEKFSQ